MVELRQTTEKDLEHFFEFQLDETARTMAAFTPKNYADKNAYLEKFRKLLADQTVVMRTVYFNNHLAGSIAKFEMEGKPELTYWIDNKFWSKGIATTALRLLLLEVDVRPIYARTAFDNHGSARVLEKNGFTLIGKDRGFANAREMEIEELIFEL